MTEFLQFRGITKSGGKDVHWGRADEDGVPFRTNQTVPMLYTHEFEQKTGYVFDAKFGTFDTKKPNQQVMGRTYAEVIAAEKTGWFRYNSPPIRYKEKCRITGRLKIMVYVEWLEPFLELKNDGRDLG